MAEPLFDMRVNYNTAYHKDLDGDEYFGYSARGVKTSDAKWQIVKIEYSDNDWIIKWADGDDLPDNVWDNVDSLTYDLLKTR